MTTLSRSYYAARGDRGMVGFNRILKDLKIAKEDFVDLIASRSRDGVWVTFTYHRKRPLRLEWSSIADGSWFVKGTEPSTIRLAFNDRVSEVSVGATSFRWTLPSSSSYVDPVLVTRIDQGKELEFALPTLAPNFSGPVILTGNGLQSEEEEDLESPISLSFQVTGSETAFPRRGQSSSLPQYGEMQIGRLVCAPGQALDQMVQQFLRVRGVPPDSVLATRQVAGPSSTTEVFLLWWTGSAAQVAATYPLPGMTVPENSAPTSVLVQFDRPISQPHFLGDDGVDRVFVDGTPYQNLAPAAVITPLDARNRQFFISHPSLALVGDHLVRIERVPTEDGSYITNPILLNWQVQNLQHTTLPVQKCDHFTGNGILTTFALTTTPVGCAVHVYMNGMFQAPDCYTLVGNQMTFGTPPFNGADIWVYYQE